MPGKTAEVFGTPYSPAAVHAPSTIIIASFSIIRRWSSLRMLSS
jgi:hypothetical protein